MEGRFLIGVWFALAADQGVRLGEPYASAMPRTLGGHRRTRIYGRLGCAGGRRWIARGHYVKQRDFCAKSTS